MCHVQRLFPMFFILSILHVPQIIDNNTYSSHSSFRLKASGGQLSHHFACGQRCLALACHKSSALHCLALAGIFHTLAHQRCTMHSEGISVYINAVF